MTFSFIQNIKEKVKKTVTQMTLRRAAEEDQNQNGM